MTREEKVQVIGEIGEQINKHACFYVTDTSNLTVEQINTVRRKCFEKGISIRVSKNTLVKLALEKVGIDNAEMAAQLKGPTSMMFSDVGNAPAKIIKELRKEFDRPILKLAYIDEELFIGDDQIDALSNLKSKAELVGEIIGLLQSPAKNVMASLQSGGNKLAGLVDTLSKREE